MEYKTIRVANKLLTDKELEKIYYDEGFELVTFVLGNIETIYVFKKPYKQHYSTSNGKIN